MDNCIFCKIVKGEAEATKIYEDEKLLAFLDIKPVNKGHMLIIPKRHYELITELDNDTTCAIFKLAKKINAAIKKSDIRSEGLNYFLADGEAAGQEVFHVHLHLIPRFTDDGFGFKFPADYNKLPERDELEEIGKAIKSNLESNNSQS